MVWVQPGESLLKATSRQPQTENEKMLSFSRFMSIPRALVVSATRALYCPDVYSSFY